MFSYTGVSKSLVTAPILWQTISYSKIKHSVNVWFFNNENDILIVYLFQFSSRSLPSVHCLPALHAYQKYTSK